MTHIYELIQKWSCFFQTRYVTNSISVLVEMLGIQQYKNICKEASHLPSSSNIASFVKTINQTNLQKPQIKIKLKENAAPGHLLETIWYIGFYLVLLALCHCSVAFMLYLHVNIARLCNW